MCVSTRKAKLSYNYCSLNYNVKMSMSKIEYPVPFVDCSLS